MSQKRHIISPLIFTKLTVWSFLLTILFSCEKFEPERTTKVKTSTVTNVSYTSCSVQGVILDKGKNSIDQHGFCWSESPNPDINDNKFDLGSRSSTGNFSYTVTGLSTNTTYYLVAYAKDKNGDYYGDPKLFTTLDIVYPTVTTTDVTNITGNSAQSGGNVTDNGGSPVTTRGVCWSTSPNPLLTDNYIGDNGPGTGSFISTITGLSQGTKYYIRAYATNSKGMTFGNELSFTTLDLPSVTTTTVTDITDDSAQSGGNVTDDGGATVTARGVCWSTSPNPTISDNFTSNESGTGSYVSNLTGLAASTTYYVRAYVTNSVGTAYGNQVSFITNPADTGIPTLTTTEITSITSTTAISGGSITDDGGSSIIVRGICWSTSQDPTAIDSHTTDGSGAGSFISNLTGLIPNTTYYVRAYATTSFWTYYGNEVSFITNDAVTDIDGNVYNIVIIGSQYWMKENLKVTKYRDGSSIPHLTVSLDWASATVGAYCYYDNDTSYLNKYGCLYNWYAVDDSRDLCPEGWHVPSQSEFIALENYLGTNAGGKLKSTSTLWSNPNTGATNESGFSALPAGFREISVDAFFHNESFGSDWWSSTVMVTTNAYDMGVVYNSGDVEQSNCPKRYGKPIRCIKD